MRHQHQVPVPDWLTFEYQLNSHCDSGAKCRCVGTCSRRPPVEASRNCSEYVVYAFFQGGCARNLGGLCLVSGRAALLLGCLCQLFGPTGICFVLQALTPGWVGRALDKALRNDADLASANWDSLEIDTEQIRIDTIDTVRYAKKQIRIDTDPPKIDTIDTQKINTIDTQNRYGKSPSIYFFVQTSLPKTTNIYFWCRNRYAEKTR